MATLHSEFYIGDYVNLQLDKRTALTITFDDILTSCDLRQHVNFSTHIHGWDNIEMIKVSDGLSGHHTVIVDVMLSRTLIQSRHNVSYIPM